MFSIFGNLELISIMEKCSLEGLNLVNAVMENDRIFFDTNNHMEIDGIIVSGKLVKTIQGNIGAAVWGCKNESEEPVATGLYIYFVTDPHVEKKTGEVAIIR